jgi:YesN/AraC family two-component response regulator
MSNSLDLIQLSQETQKLTALIVDDDQEASGIMQNIFGQLFKEVFVAEDSKDALKIYKRQRPDIVFTDIMMPGIDGLELSRQIREINKNQVIVVISASSDMNVVTEVIKIGATSFLQKPIDMKSVIETLRQITSNVKRRKKVETKVFSVNIPVHLYDKLEEDAKEERISKTAVIVRALKQFYKEED